MISKLGKNEFLEQNKIYDNVLNESTKLLQAYFCWIWTPSFKYKRNKQILFKETMKHAKYVNYTAIYVCKYKGYCLQQILTTLYFIYVCC